LIDRKEGEPRMDDLVELPDKQPEEIPEGEVPRALLAIIRLIDTYVGQLSGKIFMILIFPLIGGLTYEVIARYAFNAPTMWAYDVSYMLYGSHFMLGAVYCLYKGGHIRTDLFYEKYSVKWQGRVDAFLYLFFFFPGMIYFFLAGWEEALHSWDILEHSDTSPWRPPIYPFKTVVPVAAILLMIQGISETLKSAYAAFRGKWI
jgi:TRAP-type mannitol/chloroaromatic compound transport system permease small subunit